MKTFSTEHTPVEAIAPAAGGSDLNGDYISLKNGPVAVVCHINQGNAAQVPLVITQAQAVAGTGAKALANAVPIYANQDLASNDGLARQTDAVNFTTSAAVAHKLVIFEIDPTDLDQANGFDCIRVGATGSNAANIIAAQYVPKSKRYSNDSMIVD